MWRIWRPLWPQSLVIYVSFYKFDTLVKFRYHSFIGCQEICDSILHWHKLEMLPRKGFGGINGGDLPLERNHMPWIYLPPKHVLGCIERQGRFRKVAGYFVEVNTSIACDKKHEVIYIFLLVTNSNHDHTFHCLGYMHLWRPKIAYFLTPLSFDALVLSYKVTNILFCLVISDNV